MKKLNIIQRLILSFLVISVVCIIFTFLIYNIYTRGEGKEYDILIYILVSLIVYKNFIPFIIALSVYFAFFRGRYVESPISKIVAIPIGIIVILVSFSTFYDYFLTDKLISTLKDYNLSKDYNAFSNYRISLKNIAYENAKKELDSGNLDNATQFAQNALAYDKNDGNVLLLLKDIENKRNELSELKENYKIIDIDNLLAKGARAFSLSNYNMAEKYYNQVLKLDKYNPLAIYYINKISIIKNNKPVYTGNNIYGSLVYGQLANAIELYREGSFWRAYNNISNLYMNYPNIAEIKNYYALIVDAINEYDFFIDRAMEIRKFFIDNNYSAANYSMLTDNGITLMIDDNTIMSALYSIFFGNSLYLYDVSLIKIDKQLNITNRKIYKYGKIANSFNTNSMKNIILKSEFNNNIYDNNNNNEYIIPINISDSAIKNIKNYPYRILDYTSLSDIMLLREELPSFGYSNKRITNVLFKKIISPIYYLLLFVIIAYLSFRYNSKLSNNVNIFIHIIGVIGTIILTFAYAIFINYISNNLMLILDINLNIIIMVSFALIMIFIFLLQISRINKYVK